MSQDGNVVFTINDIDLEVAPESISVQQEDLVYSWRTLRTKSSTKIPSGHGQNLVQVKIPFMDSDILAIHRLIIEFRQSPFCFIENLYLRQTLCSEWPLGQKMAFTMTSFDIVPYPGTTNAWIVNLELIWFNYIPYLHNWLYRRDWTTDWISSKNKKGEPYFVKLSIGWDIDEDGNRSKPRLNVIEEQSVTNNSMAHQEWDTLNESYADKSLTIEDMELLHRGEIFDLLPMPSMMEKSFFVPQPGESLIYKRYINLLQRDALRKNFDIDLERLINYTPEDPGLFGRLLFGKQIILDGSARSEHVLSLHEAFLPKELAYPEVEAQWRDIRRALIDEILSYKQGVEFTFATYKSVQLPNQVAKLAQKILKEAKENVIPSVKSVVTDTDPWVYAGDNKSKIRVRRGLSEPKGFHSPLGYYENPIRSFELLTNANYDFLRWRSAEERSAEYNRVTDGGFHWGLDISDGCLNGLTPVYAVKDGYVKHVIESVSFNAGEINRWRAIELVNGVWQRYEEVLPIGSSLYDDWLSSVDYYLGGDYKSADTGTIIASLTREKRYFYVDFGDAGQQVVIDHNEARERSKYFHLAEITVSASQPVTAGQIIGYVGNTSRIAVESLVNVVSDSVTSVFDSSEPVIGLKTEVGLHLHFEYYEREDFYASRNAKSTDEISIKSPRWDDGYVIVDPRPTWAWAAENGYVNYITDNPEVVDLDLETAKAAVGASGDLQEEDKLSLINALDFMYQEGYFYYDRQEDITNVWWKPWRIAVQSVNPETEGYDEIIRTDTAVLTNVTAGLRHIVANIPILGHEFPTQQHLGSVEPYYNLEFHFLDDSGTLEGIGERGGILSALRFLLQHNARKFRLIPDSWCLRTDSFLTRLIGTLQVGDLKFAKSLEDDEVITDFILNRRTMIARAGHDTIEGNPGLSRMLWELQETNPYTYEALEANAPAKITVEAARKTILNKLYTLDFIDEYKSLAIKLLIAQAAGANTSDPQSDNFGKFSIQAHVIGDIERSIGGFGQDLSVAYVTEGSAYSLHNAWEKMQNTYNFSNMQNSDRMIVLRDDNRSLYEALRANDVPVISFNGSLLQDGNDYVAFPETTSGISEFAVEDKGNYTVYDLGSLLKQSQENLLLGEIPISKIQSLASILKNICISAEMYLAEDTSLLSRGEIKGSPLTREQVQEDLYDLPIKPRLLRSFQEYLLNTGAYFYSPGITSAGMGVGGDAMSSSIGQALSNKDQVRLILEANPNWLLWNEDKDVANEIFRSEMSWWNIITTGFDGLTLGVGPAAIDYFYRYKNAMENMGRAYSAITSDTGFESYWAANYQENVLAINQTIVNGYVRSMPLIALSASESIKDVIEDSIIGDLIGGISGESSLPAIANTQTRLTNTVNSGGYFGPHPWLSTVPFFLEPFKGQNLVVQDLDYSLDNAGNLVSPEIDNVNVKYKTLSVPYWQAVSETALAIPYASSLISDLFLNNEDFINQAGIPLPGSPLTWNIEENIEREKTRYFKQLLARLADTCLKDPDILKAFGIQDLAYLDRSEFARGKEAYSDLDLPYHPYYSTSYAVYPDFYMWNMYEDGDVFNSNIRKEVAEGMSFILKNCYNSMNKLQEGETGDKIYKPSRDKAIQDPNLDDTVALNIKYNAEGSEGMATPFYPNDVSKGPIENFYSGLSEKVKKSKSSAQEAATSDSETGIDSVTEKDNASFDEDMIQKLASVKPNGIRLENGAGYYGVGSGLQYPTRLSGSQYKALKDKVDSITNMFGSRAGFLKETGTKELPEEIVSRLDGTPLGRDLQPSHKFDLEALKQLAENSSNDLFSQKRRLARAYPTFKLYFIEEDEWENRLLNFDDFYSYNAIKDFTVTLSRKNPGDVAVVTLQNISGILDGTKRDAVVDLDYFSTKMKSKAIGDNPVTAGTVEDQPFGALVLRPGLNVQLRAGYANDPDNLNVLINGRVVDVQWNQQGDTAQIMIQSFGTELLQILKGTEPDSSDIHWTTHQLLGSLLLEPELQHFGRWEIGQLFQTGEAKDNKFDFNDYSKEAHMGRFEYSTKAVKWFFRHPLVLYGLALGGIAAISRIPGAGRLFNPSRWGTRFGFVNKAGVWLSTRLGIVGQVGQEAFEKSLVSTVASGSAKGTLVTSASRIEDSLMRKTVEEYAERLSARALVIGTKEAGPVFGANMATLFRTRGAEIANELIRTKGGSITIKEAAEAAVTLETEVGIALLKGGWMSNPVSTATGLEMIKDIGGRPITNLLNGSFTGVSKVLLGAAGVGLAVDAAVWTGIPTDIYDATVGRIQKYFSATQVSLMLSPQDDNLFPPHPKDYMLLNRKLWPQFKQWVTSLGAGIVTGSEALSNLVGHYFADEDPFDKRAPVATYQYKVNNSYIWDVLHEMSLRHPGWIYAIRPYGKQFRYTLFFGVPSQRYWSVPADNGFIHRANKVTRMLENDVTIDEYRSLYGDFINGEKLEDYDQLLQREAEVATVERRGQGKFLGTMRQIKTWAGEEIVTNDQGHILTKSGTAVYIPFVIDNRSQIQIGYVPNETQGELEGNFAKDKLEALRQATYTSRALQEYLKALNLRFVPFRRYHSISSDIDLVWNGIIGSENATYNAVDVTYMSEDIDSENIGPEGSTLVKAHAFIPESKLRVKPLPPFPNCRGYNMAMRYGMGELLFSLREMYRGEIITLGNPRIMPWDICILQDTYNSMVGPIEVEQVVHNFSHETGFITEIKPGAVVLANETSSWPLLEAMKMASMAVRNIESDSLGMTADSFGSALNVAEWIVDKGPGGDNPNYQDYAKRKMKEIFGDRWDESSGKFIGTDLTDITFGSQTQGKNNSSSLAPGINGVKTINDTLDGALDTASTVANGFAVLGGLASVGLGLAAWRFKLPFGTQVAGPATLAAKVGLGVDTAIAGGGLLASGLVLASDAMIDPPQLMSLLGGSLLMLQCLRGDSIMVVPLMKNGYPIAAGLNYHDPSMIWKNFLGDLGKFADDVIGGGREIADLWSIYGMYAWRRLPEWNKIQTDETRILTGVDLTGAL